MFHHRCWSHDRIVLLRDPIEARALWEIFARSFPELIALCLMPDHIHLILPHDDPDARLAVAESAYARWRNSHRGESGRVFAEHPPSRSVPAGDENRVVRYVLLNPCRKRLVADPLAWPWSTHRDRLGFSLRPVRPAAAQRQRFHKYVSSDKDVSHDGTPLPQLRTITATFPQVTDVVTAMARCDEGALTRRGPARRLFVRLAALLGLRDPAELSRRTGLHRVSIYRLLVGLPKPGGRIDDPVLAVAAAAVGDARFRGIATPLSRPA